ncbi:MAG: tRNA (adenosine(37)-N6)-dimethylallyltransferase MiaA [Daejeonella sp.]
MPKNVLIVVAGPTAIGKTPTAIKIAQKYQTEILSADSRQFYIEMNIGTAKPSLDELSQVKHHFINSHSITDKFSVGDFEVQGLKTLEDLFKTHHVIVLAGGSGLYINAICNGFDALPKANPGIREELNLTYQDKGIEYLQTELERVDPDYFLEVDTENPQRMIRALEVYHSTRIPFSAYRTSKIKNRPFKIIKIGLNIHREQLYQQINHRVNVMMDAGLLKEVEQLLPYRDLNALNTVGYSELIQYLDGKLNLNEAVEKIEQNTRRFAKRQLTWFKKDKEITWFEPDQIADIFEFLSCKIENN